MADIAPADGVIVDIEEDGTAGPAAAAPVDPDVVTIEEDDGRGLPKHAETQADGSVRLPLRMPVTLRYRRGSGAEVREERLDALHLHRLTGADMRAIAAASKDSQSAVAIARSARISEAKFGPMFDRMDGADIGFAARVLDHFLSSGPRTGR